MKYYIFFLLNMGMLLTIPAQNTVTVFGEVECIITKAISVDGVSTRPDGSKVIITTDSMGVFTDTFTTTLNQGYVVITFPHTTTDSTSHAGYFAPSNNYNTSGFPPIEICDQERCWADFSYSPSTSNPLEMVFMDNSYTVHPGVLEVAKWDWDFGDGNTYSTTRFPFKDRNHVYSQPGIYKVCLAMTENYGCKDTVCQTITVGDVGDISGEVFLGSGNPADSAMIYLIKFNSSSGILSAIDSTFAYASPPGGAVYSFTGVPAGSYRTKAALLPGHSQYANYLPTYHDSVLFWSTANVINLAGNATADIFMQAGNNPGGPGFIGGLISLGANKRDPGDPLENISVLLLDNNNEPVAHTLSDVNGEYGFNDLAYGTYRVHVEVLNRISTDQYISISADTTSVTDINFAVNSTTIDVPTTIEGFSFGKMLEVYPNPNTGLLHVTLELSQSLEIQLNVIDLMGRNKNSLSKKLIAGEHNMSLDLTDLPGGIYIICFRSGDQIVSRKIIKE